MDPTLFAKLLALVVLGLAVAGIIADTVRAGTWYDAARIKPPLLRDVLIEVDYHVPGERPHVYLGYWTGSRWRITLDDDDPAEVTVYQWRFCPAPPIFRRCPS